VIGGQLLTVAEARRQKMCALYPRTHQADCPDKFRAIAEWWRLHAEESAAPKQCLQYAENQERIARRMTQEEGSP
jgi:hypothetical protein